MRSIPYAMLSAALVLAGLPALGESPGWPAPETTSTAPASPANPEAHAGSGVVRATFTTAVVDREPQDIVATLSNDAQQVYYFTEFRGLDGRTLVHRWEFQGQTMAEVPFTVHGPRWRVYSSKNLEPHWLGQWTVSVVDADGRVLQTDRFAYVDARPEPTQAASPSAPTPPASPAGSMEDSMDGPMDGQGGRP